VKKLLLLICLLPEAEREECGT